jgi:hypothetical protein
MKILARCFATALVLAAAAPMAAFAQAPMTDHGTSVGGKPLASPAAVAETTLNGKALTIHYNTPSMRGRKIFGGLQPYGQVWRTGANPATSFVTAADLKIGTLDVPAGSYTIYSIPAEAPAAWMLIINKQTGQWGTVYKPEMDLGRTEMHYAKLASPQEVMSLSFEKVHGNTAELHMRWETTDAWVKIVAK